MPNIPLRLSLSLTLLSLFTPDLSAQIPLRTIVANGLTAKDSGGNLTVAHFSANQILTGPSNRARKASANPPFLLDTEVITRDSNGRAEVVIFSQGETTHGSGVQSIYTSSDSAGTPGKQIYELEFTVPNRRSMILDVANLSVWSDRGPTSIRLTGPGLNITAPQDNIVFATPGVTKVRLEFEAQLNLQPTGGRATLGAHFVADLRVAGEEVFTGSACSPARLSTMGAVDSRGSYRARIDNLPTSGSTPLLLVGIDNQRYAGLALPLNLASFGWPGCSLQVGGDLLVLPMSVSGSTAQISLPLTPNQFGNWVYFQGLLLAPGSTQDLATTRACGISWRH